MFAATPREIAFRKFSQGTSSLLRPPALTHFHLSRLLQILLDGYFCSLMDSVPSLSPLNASPETKHDKLNVSLTDEDVLARLGYKQEFKRDFSHLELFGMSFSIIGVVQSIS